MIMPSSIDLITHPLIQSTTQDLAGMPGLSTTSTPRKSARGRSRDRLILYLSWPVGNSLPPEKIGPLLDYLVRTYFRTSGTVTSAQRAVAEALNQLLLDRNLKEAASGQQSIGWLTQVVVRDEHLYLGQSGCSHTFILCGGDPPTVGEARHIYDPQLTGRGLGISRTTPIRFSQAELKPGDAVVLTSQPPDSWTAEALQVAHNQGEDDLLRWLFVQGAPTMSAVLIQVKAGTGKLETLKPISGLTSHSAPQPTVEHLDAAEDEFVDEDEEFSTSYTGPGVSEIWIGEAAPAPESKPPLMMQPPRSPDRISQTSDRDASSLLTDKIKQQSAQGETSGGLQPEKSQAIAQAQGAAQAKDKMRPLRQLLKSIGKTLKVVCLRLLNGFALLLKAILPDSSLLKLPPRTMAFFAIAVPLAVVTIASLVYLQRGQAIHYDYYFKQALESAALVESQSEPENLHLAWTTTLKFLDQAEIHRTSAESQALRNQAVQVLDSLDFVERLDFNPALTTSLSETAHISRMVTVGSDLYLLDAREGAVIRATLSNTGYVIDPFFKCEPGPYGSFVFGAIADIAPLPRGHDTKATVLGIDGNGNLLYCIPGEDPLAQPLAPPDSNWGTPEGVAFDTGDLYVLDPKTNAVWIYRNMDISKQPRFFFGQQVPPMGDVIDLTVNGSDLYLLHTDGHLTTCTYSRLAESPTRCEEPAIYVDPRPGRQDTAVIEGAHFTQILFAPPPDPSIYMLEPGSKAIYHFSVRLTFQRQYQSKQPLPSGPATAFTISHTNRTIIMAIGNEVFYAGLP
jgi:hypothetical protein